jgi:hypothetical protein
MAIVILHWGEHLFQAYQVYVMRWPRPKALGMLGLLYPWLVTSETTHYAYALIMLIGLWVLRKGFTGVATTPNPTSFTTTTITVLSLMSQSLLAWLTVKRAQCAPGWVRTPLITTTLAGRAW